MRYRLALLALVVVAPSLLVASAAWAFFTSGGTGSGAAAVATLAAPTSVSGGVAGADVALSWTGVTAPGAGTVTYVVLRTLSPSGSPVDVCGTASTHVTTTSCTDTSVHAGTYTYAVVAHWRSWSAASPPSSDVVVDRQATTTALVLGSASTTYGAEHLVTYAISVTSIPGIAPTGTVTVAAGAVALCSVTLPATTCSAPAPDTALPASGTPYTVAATYPGDVEYTGSSSTEQYLTVARDTTTTTVTAVPVTVTVGFEQTARLTAHVTTGNREALATSTEEVTVAAGSTSCVVTLVVTAGGGQGSCSIGASALAASGTPYAVATTYAGDTDLVGSASAPGPTLEVASAPTITSATLPEATRTQAGYSDPLTVDGGSAPFTWSLVSGALPAGLTLDPSGTVAGAVDPSAVGTTFTVEVVDGSGASTTAVVSLAVADPPVIDTTPLAPAVAGGAFYSQTLTATGGVGPMSWNRDVGALPVGLHLDTTTGVISGNLDPSATSSSITVTVTDANNVSDTVDQTFAITVTSVLVQEKSLSFSNADLNLLTLNFGTPVAAGHTLILSVAQACATKLGVHVVSPVVSASWNSTAFVPAQANGCTGTGDAELWYLQGTGSATGSAATTVTVHLTPSAAVSLLNVSEYTGVLGLDPGAGACHQASGTSATVTPGAATPSGPGDLVVTAAFVAHPSAGDLTALLAPYGFSPLNPAGPGTGFAAMLVDPTSSTVPYSYLQPVSGPWATVECAFSRS